MTEPRRAEPHRGPAGFRCVKGRFPLPKRLVNRVAAPALTVLTLATVLVGCAEAPERASEAAKLENAIRAMPGVTSVAVN
jgi:hypothetical protein